MGRSPGSVSKGDKPPHLQAKGGAGCQVPVDLSLLWVSAQVSSCLEAGVGGQGLLARSCHCPSKFLAWLLEANPCVTIVTNYQLIVAVVVGIMSAAEPLGSGLRAGTLSLLAHAQHTTWHAALLLLIEFIGVTLVNAIM